MGFRSLTEAIDNTTPGDRLVFHLFAALGQFERDLIQERTRAGLAAAAARGRTGGRRLVMTEDKLRRAREHIAPLRVVQPNPNRSTPSYPRPQGSKPWPGDHVLHFATTNF